MSRWSFEISSCRRSGAWARRLRCLCTVQRWTALSGHSAASAFSRPDAPSTTTNSGVRNPRRMRSSSSARQAASLSPPMLLIASSIFWPSARTPSARSNEIEVACLSSRVAEIKDKTGRLDARSEFLLGLAKDLENAPPEVAARYFVEAAGMLAAERNGFFDPRRRGTVIEDRGDIILNLALRLLSLGREAEAFAA